jgi:hypothetical protein
VSHLKIKIPSKKFGRQRREEGLNSGVKGLTKVYLCAVLSFYFVLISLSGLKHSCAENVFAT